MDYDSSVPLPPHSVDAERAVLGGLLLAPFAWDAIDFLKRDHFYLSQHRRIYETIESMIDRSQTVDAMTVQDAINGDANERAYIAGLALSVVSVANIRRYAEIVRDRWLLREVQRIATTAASDAYGVGADAREIAEHAEAGFLNVLDDKKGGEEIGFGDAVKRHIETEDAPAAAVLPTGLSNLDRLLTGGGLKPGQLVIIAARPGMGKSALAFNIAERVARDRVVAGFTMEMSADELAGRAVKYHTRLLGGRDEAALHLMSLQDTLRIDSGTASVTHIRVRCTRMKRQRGLGLIVVDYLQLMDSRGETREQEIAKLSRGLKAVAMELAVPVIAVAQINRGVEQRQDKRPMLSDLRESGAVEQDADIVIMLYRDEYYVQDSPWRGIAEVIVRKQRGGPTGTAYLSFEPEVTRFHDYSGPIPKDAPAAPRGGKVVTPDFKSRASGE